MGVSSFQTTFIGMIDSGYLHKYNGDSTKRVTNSTNIFYLNLICHNQPDLAFCLLSGLTIYPARHAGYTTSGIAGYPTTPSNLQTL